MRQTYSFFLFIFLIGFHFSCQQEPSNLSLSSIFSDHMVLQQAESVPIWGTATPYSKISIDGSWGNSVGATTNSEGEWDTEILMPAAGGPFELTISTKDTAITIKDVMAGEVWLCSGQSNMEMPLKGWLPNDPIANSAVKSGRISAGCLKVSLIAILSPHCS